METQGVAAWVQDSDMAKALRASSPGGALCGQAGLEGRDSMGVSGASCAWS